MRDKIEAWFPKNMITTAAGFDDAIIGIEESSMRVIYSSSKCIDILMKNMGMCEEDAVEYFYDNVQQTYYGNKNPIWSKDDL
jgi:chorismate mutase